MIHSEQINEIGTALSKAQAAIKGAAKTSSNPFYKSTYADLASCLDAVREPLSKNGLAIIQTPSMDGDEIALTTMLIHSSGQWVSDVMSCKPDKSGPQAMGSVITYLRRYALSAMVGLAQVDDDAEAATDRHKPQNADEATITGSQIKTINQLLDETDSDNAIFLNYIGAGLTVDSIKKSQFKYAVALLRDKRKKQQQAEKDEAATLEAAIAVKASGDE